MVNASGKDDINEQSLQTTSTTTMSEEQMIAWKAQVLEMTDVQMTKRQNLLSVQASLLQGDIEEALAKCQEDPAMLPSSLTNKLKSTSLQNHSTGGVEPQKDSQFSSGKPTIRFEEGSMERQVEEVKKNLQLRESNQDEALRILEQCQCCRHYGLPCLQKQPSGGKVEMSQDHQN